MEKILKKFEGIGNAFLAKYVKPEYEEIIGMGRRNNWEEWKTGLLFFVGYSFERQGRPPDWAHIAKDIIEEKLRKINNINVLNEEDIWERFRKKWTKLGKFDGKTEDKIGFNERLNPLAVKKQIRGRDKGTSDKKQELFSVIEFIKEKLKDYDYDIVKFAKRKLAEGKVKEAWEELKKIQGVGDKIASFFLRDVAVVFEKEIELNNIESKERKYLQPIDIWVKRCCNYLYKLESKAFNDTVKILDYQHYVVECCMDNRMYIINPEKVNMGMWLFSSQIVGNHYKLSKIFEESEESEIVKRMENAIKKYISRGNREIDELNKIVSR